MRKAFDKKSSSLYFKFPKKPNDKELALADQMVSLMQQAISFVPGGESKDLSAAWIPDGEDNYVLAIYINDYSQSGSTLADAVPEQVTQMTNKINELFGSQVMDPNEGGVVAEPMPVEDAVTDTAVIGGADGPTASFAMTENDVMEQAVNEAMTEQ